MSNEMHEMTENVDKVLSHLNTLPCYYPERVCLEPRPGEGIIWRGMHPERMCLRCRTYWYLSVGLFDFHRLKVLVLEATEEKP